MAMKSKTGCLSTGLSVNWKEKCQEFASYFFLPLGWEAEHYAQHLQERSIPPKIWEVSQNSLYYQPAILCLLRSQHDSTIILKVEEYTHSSICQDWPSINWGKTDPS